MRAQASTDDARTLAFRAQDARFEKKNLIPLRVTRAFTSVDAPALESQLMRDEALDLAKSRIEWLAARRYVGVFHVTDYAEPHWIWRLDRAKAEWVPGWICGLARGARRAQRSSALLDSGPREKRRDECAARNSHAIRNDRAPDGGARHRAGGPSPERPREAQLGAACTERRAGNDRAGRASALTLRRDSNVELSFE